MEIARLLTESEFTQQTLNTGYVPSTMLGTGGTSTNKIVLKNLMAIKGKQMSKYTKCNTVAAVVRASVFFP